MPIAGPREETSKTSLQYLSLVNEAKGSLTMPGNTVELFALKNDLTLLRAPNQYRTAGGRLQKPVFNMR